MIGRLDHPHLARVEGAHAQGLPDSDFRRQIESQTPLGRIGQPADVAPAVVFLAGPDAAWVTGETWHVAGGYR